MKIAVVGSTNVDLVSYVDKIPAAGETRTVKNFLTAHGGKGANQAVAAVRLGAEVLMVTAVGDDLFGKAALENFRQNGIDTAHVNIISGEATGVATILVEESGQNRIMIHGGANNFLTPEIILQAADDLKKCSMIVLQLEIPLASVYATINFAKENKIPVLLNPAPATDKLSIEMACKCDFFVPNETELGILTGMTVNTMSEIKSAAKFLLDKGLKNVIVTLGSRGSILMSKTGSESMPTPKVKAVDSTGAGDAFIGCFAEHFSRTKNILSSMKVASQYAALSVTRKGTQSSYPSANEFKNISSANNN